MAAEKKKYLRELLEDDQEPFHLNHYIADLRSQMGYSDLRVKKLKPQNAAVLPPGLFTCGESSCFLATHHTNKSPLFELRSPPKKESSDSGVFLRIPARTAAILLEAATRIQKQQSEKANKTNNRARNRGNAFGLFGSVLKRLTNRKAKPRSDNADKCFCESPFHFVLHATLSTSSQQTPQFTSTATSPARRSTEDEDSDETESLEKVRGQDEEDKEEEDKEQCSPVSVLDPLEKEEDHHQREVPDHLNLLSCSFEVVQRTKRRLLKKLCRFEKLAGMDPVDLEGKMSEEQEEENEESVEDDNMRVYDLAEEYEDVDEAMARESGWAEEERRKKWMMMNAWRLGMGAEEAAETVVQKDIRGEAGEWTRHGGEMEEAVSEIELSIFIFLIDEFSHELVSSFMNK
ncbi:PREDICTED: uncharacterized protein LOC106329193 [Brassica oleracea var. oleracea]|uniref:DUF4378 domain-containing protein n=1 Tax=Brassica oleracea var. oleracea TaxID=109376 RepID=A0A0D3B585_BRAOL|nr:PREDICTED: uncharacterized protein LOC106329193 [Brassica oleracea var. oleracea]